MEYNTFPTIACRTCYYNNSFTLFVIESDNAEATYVHLQPPFKKNTQHECFSYTPSSDEQYFTNMISIKTSTIEEISMYIMTSFHTICLIATVYF